MVSEKKITVGKDRHVTLVPKFPIRYNFPYSYLSPPSPFPILFILFLRFFSSLPLKWMITSNNRYEWSKSHVPPLAFPKTTNSHIAVEQRFLVLNNLYVHEWHQLWAVHSSFWQRLALHSMRHEGCHIYRLPTTDSLHTDFICFIEGCSYYFTGGSNPAKALLWYLKDSKKSEQILFSADNYYPSFLSIRGCT